MLIVASNVRPRVMLIMLVMLVMPIIMSALVLGCAGRAADAGDDEVAGTSESSESGLETSETSSSTSDTGEGPYACVDPQPILQAGTRVPSGFVRCADGFVHRVEPVECVTPQGPDEPSCAGLGAGTCANSADCVDAAFGSCTWSDKSQQSCACAYGCASDADCEAGFICACAGVAGDASTCIPANCASTADCGEGLCGLSRDQGCCWVDHGVACTSPDSACHVDADCSDLSCDDLLATPYQCSAEVDFGQLGAWTCQAPGSCECAC